MSSKTSQSVSFIWVYALLGAFTFLVAFAIGCGEDKKKEKKEGPSTGANVGASTGDAQGKNPAASQAPKDDGNEEKKEEPSGFYTAKDFPKGTQSLTSEIAKSSISRALSTIPFPARIESSNTGNLPCMAALENTLWTGDAKSISFQFSKKMDCTKGSEAKKFDMEMDIKMSLTCQKDAFASFVGKKFKEVSGSNLLKLCKDSKSTFLQNFKSSSVFISSKAPKQTFESSDKSAYSTANGTPCSITTTANTMEIPDDCQFFSQSTSQESDGKVTKTTLIGSFKDAKGPLDTNKPFKSGSFGYSINNWKGSVTFDATLTPSFEASSGSTKVRGKLETNN